MGYDSTKFSKSEEEPTLPFGKYKGWVYGEVPDSYLKWIEENTDSEKKAAKYAKAEMDRRAAEGISIGDDDIDASKVVAKPAKTNQSNDFQLLNARIDGLVARIKKLEARVFKDDIGETISFDSDDIPF